MPKKMSKAEMEWRVEDDARILERYSEILQDSKRLEKARMFLKDKMEQINKTLKIK